MNPELQDLIARAMDATQRDALDESEALCQQAEAAAMSDRVGAVAVHDGVLSAGAGPAWSTAVGGL